MKTENSKWFLVYTKAKEEQRAQKNLENQGFETFIPMIAYETMSKSKPIALATMFPRYLFIKIDTERDSWIHIKSTRGVSHLVVFGEKLAEVPDQVMAFLKTKVDEHNIFRQKTTRKEFQKGDNLVIKKGIFKNKNAIFLSKKSKERVRILLRFVNHLVTAEIPKADVGEKEIIAAFKI